MILTGDIFQQIFKYRGSNIDYMINPTLFFKDYVTNNGIFERFKLSICFRITHQIADWLNKYMHPKHLQFFMSKTKWEKIGPYLLDCWGTKGIQAIKDGPPVDYFVTNWNYGPLSRYLHPFYKKYSVEDIAILCYSGQSKKSPLWKLLNLLSELNKPNEVNWACLWQTKQDNALYSQEDDIKGKRIVSTIHSFKGGETKVDIVFVDDGLEKNFEDILDLYCIYLVGTTRGSEKLIVVQNSNLPFATIRTQLKEEGKERNQIQSYSFNKSKEEINAKRYYYNGMSLNDLYNYVSYNTWLDREVIQMKKIQVLNPIQEESEYWIESMDGITKENILPLYNFAIELALQVILKKLDCIPSYSLFNPEKTKKEKELKEVRTWINQHQNKNVWKEKNNKKKY